MLFLRTGIGSLSGEKNRFLGTPEGSCYTNIATNRFGNTYCLSLYHGSKLLQNKGASYHL